MEDMNDKYHQYLNEGDSDSSHLLNDDQELKDFLDSVPKSRPADFSKSKADIWNAIEEEIAEEPESKTVHIQWRKVFSVAAVITLLIISGIVAFNPFDEAAKLDFVANSTELQEVGLPDGSKVFLNAVSTLSHNEKWDRTLNLSGEAFFEVTKGEKFTVNTQFGTVQVLGTSFNVSTRNEALYVSCKTGKVKVSFANSAEQPVFLTKGQSVMFEDNVVTENAIDLEKIGNWKTGTFHYDGRPVDEAFEEVKRQYNVSVKFAKKKLANRPYNGYFFKDDLETSLSMICDPLNLDYKIDGTTIVIEAKNE